MDKPTPTKGLPLRFTISAVVLHVLLMVTLYRLGW